jgi:uncharacterized protein with HEPN domain
MNDDWKGFGSGRGLILRYYPGIHLEELWKTTKNIVLSNLWAKISTQDIPNTRQEC